MPTNALLLTLSSLKGPKFVYQKHQPKGWTGFILSSSLPCPTPLSTISTLHLTSPNGSLPGKARLNPKHPAYNPYENIVGGLTRRPIRERKRGEKESSLWLQEKVHFWDPKELPENVFGVKEAEE